MATGRGPHGQALKILFITESWPPAMNGVATSSVRIVRELQALGHQVRVIAPATEGSPRENLHAARSLRIGPSQEYTVARLGASSMRMIESWRPDVIHVASPLSLGYAGLRAARRYAIPAIAAYMTDFSAFTRQSLRRVPGRDRAAQLFEWAQQASHSMARVNLACSHYALDTLRQWKSPGPREWLRAVDTQRFVPDRRLDRLAAQPLSAPLRIGYAGRLAPEKELDLLAHLRGIPGTELVFIGDGPSRSKLEGLIPEAHFTGKLGGSDYPKALSSLDLFIHPGRGETLSQVVLEALASGVPCVVPDRGSASTELVTPGRTGAHFIAGDPSSLRRVVLDLITDSPSSCTAIASSVTHRTWKSSMDSLMSAYDEALCAS